MEAAHGRVNRTAGDGSVTSNTDNKGNTGSESIDAEVVQPTSPGAAATVAQRAVSSSRLVDRLPAQLDSETGAMMTRNPMVDPGMRAGLTGQAPEAPDSKGSVGQPVAQTVVPKWGAGEIEALIKDLGIAKFSERDVALGWAVLPGLKSNGEKLFSPSHKIGPFDAGLLRDGLRKACLSTYSGENYNYVQAVAAYKARPSRATASAIQSKFVDVLNIKDRDRRALAAAVTQALAGENFPANLFDPSRDQVYQLVHSQQNVKETFIGIEIALEQRGRDTKGRG